MFKHFGWKKKFKHSSKLWVEKDENRISIKKLSKCIGTGNIYTLELVVKRITGGLGNLRWSHPVLQLLLLLSLQISRPFIIWRESQDRYMENTSLNSESGYCDHVLGTWVGIGISGDSSSVGIKTKCQISVRQHKNKGES